MQNVRLWNKRNIIDIATELEAEDYVPKLMERNNKRNHHYGLTSKDHLFVHSLAIFNSYLKSWIITKREEFDDESKRIIEYLSKLYSINKLSKKQIDSLIKKARNESNSFKYALEIAVIDTKLSSLNVEPTDFLFLSVVTSKYCISFLNYQMIEFEMSKEFKKLLPKFKVNDNFETIIIGLDTNDLKNNDPIIFKLQMIRNSKLRSFSRNFSCKWNYKNIETIGEFEITPSEIHPEGYGQWIRFGDITLKIRIMWRLTRRVLFNTERYLKINRIRHHEMFYSFLKFRVKQNATNDYFCVNHLSNRVSNNKDIQKFENINQLYCRNESNDSPIGRLNDLQIRKSIFGISQFATKSYCVSSEWCNLNSFYYHNPMMRYLMVQNHRLLQISDELIIPMHYLGVCKLFSKDRVPCFGLLISASTYLHEYLNVNLKHSHDVSMIDLSKERRMLEESYFWLRSALTPKMFFIGNDPMTDLLDLYIETLQWLNSRLGIDDSFIDIHFRILFFKILHEWIIRSLRNEPIEKCGSFETYSSQTHSFEAQSVTEKNQSSNNIDSDDNISIDDTENDHSLNGIESDHLNDHLNDHLSKCDDNSLTDLFKVKRENDTEIIFRIRMTPIISLIFKLRNLLMQYEPKLPEAENDNNSLRFKNLSFKFCVGVNKVLQKQTETSKYQMEIVKDHHITYTQFLQKCATLKFYSVIYEMQKYYINLTNFYINEEFNFRIFICKLNKYFADNFWPETAARNFHKQNTIEQMFPNFERIKRYTGNAFKKFFHNEWGMNRLESKNVEDDDDHQLVSDLITEFAALKNWYDSNRANEKVFANIIVILTKSVEQIQQSFSKHFNESENIIQSNSELLIIRPIVYQWLAEAAVYNLICIGMYFIKQLYHLCKESHDRDNHRFPMLIPGWYKLIKCYKIFDSKFDSIGKCSSNYDSDGQINKVLSDGKSNLKLLFQSIYSALTWKWLREIEFFGKWERNGKLTVFKHKLFQLHLICGLSLSAYFRKEFPDHYLLVRSRLNSILEKRKDARNGHFYILINQWFKDIKAQSSENPFDGHVWSTILRDENSLMIERWKKIKVKRSKPAL